MNKNDEKIRNKSLFIQLIDTSIISKNLSDSKYSQFNIIINTDESNNSTKIINSEDKLINNIDTKKSVSSTKLHFDPSPLTELQNIQSSENLIKKNTISFSKKKKSKNYNNNDKSPINQKIIGRSRCKSQFDIQILYLNRYYNAKNKKSGINFLRDSSFSLKITNFFIYLKLYSLILSIFVSINIVLTLIDNKLELIKINDTLGNLTQYFTINSTEITKINKTNEETNLNNLKYERNNNLKFLNFLLVIVMDFLVYKYYKIELEIEMYLLHYSKNDNLFSSGLWKQLVLEIIILSLFIPPISINILFKESKNYYYFYSLYSLNTLICFLKIFFILRTLSYNTKWTNNNNVGICNKYIGRSSSKFCLKALIQENSLYLMITCLVLFLLYFSYVLDLYDNLVITKKIDQSNQINFDEMDFIKSCWIFIQSVLTLGYGDLFPKTFFAKISTITSVILSFSFTSKIFYQVRRFVTLDNEEKNFYFALKRLKIEEQSKKKGRMVIINILKLRLAYFKKVSDFEKIYKLKSLLNYKFSINLSKFRDIKCYKLDCFFRLCNKFSYYFILNRFCLQFDKIIQQLKSIDFETEKEMTRLNNNIDYNYNKFHQHIGDRLLKCNKDYKELNDVFINNNQKIIRIGIFQQKISEFIINLNNSHGKQS